MVRGVIFEGIFREFWVGVGNFFSFSGGFERKRETFSNWNFAFTRFDTEQWWDGFSWWFWTWAFFLSWIYFFVYFFMVIYVLFLMFNFGLLLNPTYLVDVLIGDRLEKSVLSLMGLMRTDPPFLRRENKVVKFEKKSEREIKRRQKIKVGMILRKKMWKTRRRKNNNG